MLGAMGMEAFAERGRRELLITGETARKRTAQPARTPPGPASEPLTAQEAQVAAGPRGSVEPGDWCPPVHQLPAPFSATWARCSPSLASAPAGNSIASIRRPGYAPAALTLAGWLVARRVLGRHWPVALLT
jgi:hypothetical protein